MKQSNFSIRRLSLFFLAWIVLANGSLLVTPLSTLFGHWLGARLLWALLIPLCCLIWLNPRRSWGLLLATAGIIVWTLLRVSRRRLPGRPWRAGVSIH